MHRRIQKEAPHLLGKLTTQAELEGLLSLAVGSLRRLMERGKFEVPESVQATRHEYRERLDTITALGTCVLSIGLWTPRTDLYPAYRAWCSNGGACQRSSVLHRLRSPLGDQITDRAREGIRGFPGIGIC
jgi:phage/plasmid-associated DNA primase